MRSPCLAATAVLLLVGGCFDDMSDPPVDDGFENLITRDWELKPSEQKYWCIRKTVTEDIYISSFQSMAPPGTHHTILSAGYAPLSEDGVTECISDTHNFERLLFESSSSTDRLQMPDGVGAKISAGQQLNLNVHVLNTTDQKLTGTTGVQFLRTEADQIEDFAAELRFGKLALDVPPGESTHSVDCPMSADATFFGVTPHMHAYGTHMKVVATNSLGSETVIYDEPFDYDTLKSFHPLPRPIVVQKDDVITLSCSYDNYTPYTLHWGPDAFTAEMCFAGIYLYPAENQDSGFCAL